MIILRKDIIGIRDFEQEDIYRFIEYGGKEMYEDPEFSSIPKNVKLGSLKRGKFKEKDLKKIVSITFPFNQKVYNSQGMFYVWDGKSKLDKYIDIIVNVNDGLMTFSDGGYYLPLAATLTKYWKQGCGWNYIFIKTPNQYPKPVISVPEKTWDGLLKAFTEYLVFLRLFVGIEFRIYFHNSKKPAEYQKEFSGNSIATFIPTVLNLGYDIFAGKKVQKRLHLKVSNAGKPYNTAFEQKFKRYIEKNYPDLIVVKLGTGSCYINPRNIDEKTIKMIKKSGLVDPDRKRTMMDWILWGYDNNKHLLFSNDLDNSLALCHEVGHYLIEKEGGVKRYLQNHMKRGLLGNKGFVKFCGYLIGLAGPIGEIVGILTTFFLNSPLLYIEFLASYRGMEELKKAGGTEKEIEEAKKVFKAAWGTYLGGVIKNASFASYGRLTGALARKIYFNEK